MLYKVWALDKPLSLGGEEELIAEIVLNSMLNTSLWADKKMYFRHTRFDDDCRYHPEWVVPDEVNTLLIPFEQLQIQPYKEKRASSCPFDWLFE